MDLSKVLNLVFFVALLLQFVNFSQYSRLELIAIILFYYVIYRIYNCIVDLIFYSYFANYFGISVKWKRGSDVWAIITGGTDGIGVEYAKQLAAKGYSLVIISRTEHKLLTVANEISSLYPQCKHVKTIVADFKRTDIYDNISLEINALENVDVLVNNVGILYENGVEYFTEIPSDYNDAYLNVNMRSYVKMIEIVLPIMVRQKRGIIINLSSIAGTVPNPLMTVYSASKSFSSFLSQALSIEYESKGVIIQAVHPGQVVTNMSKNMNKSFFTVNADEYVTQALRTVGLESSTYGHWKHKLLGFIFNCLICIFGEGVVSKLLFVVFKKYRSDFYEQNNKKMTFN